MILVRVCYPVKKTRAGARAISMDNHGGLSLPNHVHGIIVIVGDGPRAVPNGATPPPFLFPHVVILFTG